jgi:hypothetical protein
MHAIFEQISSELAAGVEFACDRTILRADLLLFTSKVIITTIRKMRVADQSIEGPVEAHNFSIDPVSKAVSFEPPFTNPHYEAAAKLGIENVGVVLRQDSPPSVIINS